MTALMDVLRFLNPQVNIMNCLINGDGVIEFWDDTILGIQPTQAQIDVARPLTEMAIAKVSLEQAVQSHLDAGVQVRNYANILSACTYANSSNVTFKAEGSAAVAWRDAVWMYCYGVLAAVQTGTRQIPTEAELIAELKLQCPLVW